MYKTLAVLCGAALIAGCSSVPIEKVESNSRCDYALMAKMERQWQPTYIHRYWVNCPQVPPKS
jgi:hypothetical protein